ncbi:hypothetical protein OH76DRAFT_343017 [Lentinus brumalis]|uniref:Uncharacterized protein n=1 Tax=Lentinus brumalis TaxID=2498619 RepID=A0A371DEV0_9APHY|nr:hypothetical protein OH76DRAFT_343017 [Polyporus brumalis]
MGAPVHPRSGWSSVESFANTVEALTSALLQSGWPSRTAIFQDSQHCAGLSAYVPLSPSAATHRHLPLLMQVLFASFEFFVAAGAIHSTAQLPQPQDLPPPDRVTWVFEARSHHSCPRFARDDKRFLLVLASIVHFRRSSYDVCSPAEILRSNACRPQ